MKRLLCLAAALMIALNLFVVPIVTTGAEELPQYDYSSFVGEWSCFIEGHTTGTTRTYSLSISGAKNDAICLAQMDYQWYPIQGQKVYIDIAPWNDLNFAVHHDTDFYAVELTFYNDSICMTAYSKSRSNDTRFVDNYWFTSDTIKPRRIETGNYSVVLNGTKLEFDQSPVICGDRILVPLRKIFEELNAEVYYHEKTNYGGFSDKQACIDIIMNYTNYLSLNGIYQENDWWLLSKDFNNPEDTKTVDLDVSPIILNGRTLVPVRVLTEALGGEVVWDENTNTVYISCNIAKNRRKNEEMDNIQYFTCDDALEFVKKQYFVPDSSENGIDVDSISGEYVVPVDHKDDFTFDKKGKCYWFFICNGLGIDSTLAVYQDGTIIRQMFIDDSYDYGKILNGDLSDFAMATA